MRSSTLRRCRLAPVEPSIGRALSVRDRPENAARGASLMSVHGRVVSVNVGRPRLVERRRGRVPTSIWKEPVSGRLAVRGTNVAGDRQADPARHGGPRKAVYAYASEDAAWWSEQLGRPLAPGAFGENLTLAGVDVSGARVGERWRVGTALLEVCGPRMPCWKLELKMGLGGLHRALHRRAPAGRLPRDRRGGRRRGERHGVDRDASRRGRDDARRRGASGQAVGAALGARRLVRAPGVEAVHRRRPRQLVERRDALAREEPCLGSLVGRDP